MSASGINRIYQKIESIREMVQGCNASQPLAFPQPGRAVSERAANQIWASISEKVGEILDIVKKSNSDLYFQTGVRSFENWHHRSPEQASIWPYSSEHSSNSNLNSRSTLERLQITSTAGGQIQQDQSNRTPRGDLRARILASRANIYADRLQQLSPQISTGSSQAHRQGLDQQSPRSSQQVSTINRSNEEVLKRINSATETQSIMPFKGDFNIYRLYQEQNLKRQVDPAKKSIEDFCRDKMKEFVQKWTCSISQDLAVDPVGFSTSDFFDKNELIKWVEKRNEDSTLVTHPTARRKLIKLTPVSKKNEMMNEFIELFRVTAFRHELFKEDADLNGMYTEAITKGLIPREETESVKGGRTRKRLSDLKRLPSERSNGGAIKVDVLLQKIASVKGDLSRKDVGDLKRLPPKIIK